MYVYSIWGLGPSTIMSLFVWVLSDSRRRVRDPNSHESWVCVVCKHENTYTHIVYVYESLRWYSLYICSRIYIHVKKTMMTTTKTPTIYSMSGGLELDSKVVVVYLCAGHEWMNLGFTFDYNIHIHTYTSKGKSPREEWDLISHK